MTRTCPEGTTVLGDRDLIYRAVYNVLGNAMQAMPEGGTIHVQATPPAAPAGEEGPPLLTLAVHDSGPGFDEKNLDKLKDPFFSTKDTGTGLGLAIVTSIVESHGGSVTLTNHPEGGAEVQLTLPAPAPKDGGDASPEPRQTA
jgi:hypothetical protein